METLSEKYVAGLIDSDGCITIKWQPQTKKHAALGMNKAYLCLSWSQRNDRDEALHLMHQQFGGCIRQEPRGPYTEYSIAGKPAVMLLERVEKFLVNDRRYAKLALEVQGKLHDKKVMTAWLKEQRKIRVETLPNYPSRKWMAGYIDGDGCFSAAMNKGEKSATMVLIITATHYNAGGLELIQKAFGGTIAPIPAQPHVNRLQIRLNPSKALEILNYCGPYLVIKRDQGLFVKGCAEMGNFRDGETITAIMKQLKAQPHRLSEMGAVADLLKQVRRFSDEDMKENRRIGLKKYWGAHAIVGRES